MEYLYVIAASKNGPVKLGYSKHPDKRLKQLQTGNPEILILHHCEMVEIDNIRRAEKELHRILGYCRLKGEWFNMSVDDAILEAVHARMCA